MKRNKRNIFSGMGWSRALLWAALPLWFTSCIDEDLSDCGVDFAVEYRMELSTSLRMSIDEQLTSPAEKELAAALKRNLADILTDKARLMDLSFFEAGNGSVAKHLEMKPDANTLAMTIYLDRGDYDNIALAATGDPGKIRIVGGNNYKTLALQQDEADTIDAHSTALYRGYTRMAVSNQSGRFYVPLYMQNAVPVLVVDPANSPAQVVGAYTRGMASGMRCADSVFVVSKPAVIRTRRTEAGGLIALHSVCFPSADQAEQQMRVNDGYDEEEGSLWQMDLYTRLPDGKYVKNILYIKNSLLAGEVQIIKVKLTEGGEVTVENPEVGVSVELDWKPGHDFDVEM